MTSRGKTNLCPSVPFRTGILVRPVIAYRSPFRQNMVHETGEPEAVKPVVFLFPAKVQTV